VVKLGNFSIKYGFPGKVAARLKKQLDHFANYLSDHQLFVHGNQPIIANTCQSIKRANDQ
jgi:hypothetical protein